MPKVAADTETRDGHRNCATGVSDTAHSCPVNALTVSD